jgi:hypothetical protein
MQALLESNAAWITGWGVTDLRPGELIRSPPISHLMFDRIVYRTLGILDEYSERPQCLKKLSLRQQRFRQAEGHQFKLNSDIYEDIRRATKKRRQ